MKQLCSPKDAALDLNLAQSTSKLPSRFKPLFVFAAPILHINATDEWF